MKIKILLCLLSLFIFTGCTSSVESEYVNKEQTLSYLNKGAILIDVRTDSEYQERHIEGAISIPLDRIEEITNFYSQDQIIIVYCQSGNRSHMALNKLKQMNYKNVYDLGSIENWG